MTGSEIKPPLIRLSDVVYKEPYPSAENDEQTVYMEYSHRSLQEAIDGSLCLSAIHTGDKIWHLRVATQSILYNPELFKH